jgi:hypothetical protein
MERLNVLTRIKLALPVKIGGDSEEYDRLISTLKVSPANSLTGINDNDLYKDMKHKEKFVSTYYNTA